MKKVNGFEEKEYSVFEIQKILSFKDFSRQDLKYQKICMH